MSSCIGCKSSDPLTMRCSDCRQLVWCSAECCVGTQTVHEGCGQIGARRPAGAIRGLLGKSDFRGTLSNLFTSLLDVRPMNDAFEAVKSSPSMEPGMLAAASKRLTDALLRVETRLDGFEKMLQSVDKKTGTALQQTRATLSAAMRYDTVTALRLALRHEPMPDILGPLDPNLTFKNSFAWAENFVSASANTRRLSQTPVTQPLSSQFLFVMESPPGSEVATTRAFKDALRNWTIALDSDFSKLIKA